MPLPMAYESLLDSLETAAVRNIGLPGNSYLQRAFGRLIQMTYGHNNHSINRKVVRQGDSIFPKLSATFLDGGVFGAL